MGQVERFRLTKQEALDLAQSIDSYVQTRVRRGDRVSVADVRSVYGTAKEGFARSRLNKLVAVGILAVEDVCGLKMYYSSISMPTLPPPVAVDDSSPEITIAIECIDTRIAKLRQQIDYLEEARKILLADDSNPLRPLPPIVD